MSFTNFFSLPTHLLAPLVALILLILVVLVFTIYGIVTRHMDRNNHSDPNGNFAAELENPDDVLAFNLDNDLALQTATRYAKTYKRLTRIALGGLVAVTICSIIIAARPARVDAQNTSTNPRDIVLCLDVSGSALAYDRQIIAAYSQIVKNMHGERIGLSIFNSTSKTVFPLTDDYDVINNQLNYAYSLLNRVQSQESIDAMSDKEYEEVNDWLEGTQNVENSTSLIGDGLVSCATMLPAYTNQRVRQARSSSIILATDNVPSGKQTFTLEEALDQTQKASIHVDALYIGTDKTSQSKPARELESAITQRNGTYVDLNSDDTAEDIVNAVLRTRSGLKREDNDSNLVDAPEWIACISALAFIIFIAASGRIKR